MELIHNFRDFGGYRSENGWRVRRGVLYRSGHLATMSDGDMARLRGLGIRTVCDLRTDRECARRPDRLDPDWDIRYQHIPMKSRRHDDSGFLSQLLSLLFGKARTLRFDEVMEAVYREYVTDFHDELASILRMVAEPGSLPILIHCTAGKDRTGLAVAIILTALGVSPEVMREDYLRSNEHLAGFRRDVTRQLKRFALFGVSWERVIPLFEARAAYLDAAFDQMSRSYGGFQEYLNRGLRFPEADLTRLRDLLREPMASDAASMELRGPA